jgi:Protein of unknown function (DUF2924)
MSMNVAKVVAQLRQLTTGQLRTRYAETHGESTRSGHRDWLVKKIAWRLQMLALGDLSERARERAAALANDADLRVLPPRCKETPPLLTSPAPPKRDPRIPPIGSTIQRDYKGEAVRVIVTPNGFLFGDQEYPTLTSVAKVITGSHLNGFAFFKLGGER